MLELYQFELSHYCEKVRFILDYKELPYRKIEVTPGIGQLDIYRMSGQRQVPVLKDGTEVIADSTAIAEYLDKTYPDKPVIPADPKLRGLTLIIEQWADESIGLSARQCLLSAIGRNADLRTSVLPSSTPDFVKNLIGAFPSDLLNGLGIGLPDPTKAAQDVMKHDLAALCFILEQQPYLVTDHPTLADFAVAALTMYVKFPEGPYLDLPSGLKGKGTPGIADVGVFEPFFSWRDRLYTDYRKASTLPTSTTSGSGPTSIDID
ncbi:MAG: glutathione S-transferase family protein [Oculatellaceae cyanobacterium bins.114]|nr:glutathione S-transferase family protein [Oculatellaceae cyanobacterium bins.114]